MTVLRFRPRFVERDPRSKKKSVQLIADEDEDICRATDGFESGEGRSVRAAVEGVGKGIDGAPVGRVKAAVEFRDDAPAVPVRACGFERDEIRHVDVDDADDRWRRWSNDGQHAAHSRMIAALVNERVGRTSGHGKNHAAGTRAIVDYAGIECPRASRKISTQDRFDPERMNRKVAELKHVSHTPLQCESWIAGSIDRVINCIARRQTVGGLRPHIRDGNRAQDRANDTNE